MWERRRHIQSILTTAGTIFLCVIGLLALRWAQRTFTQMELDFRFTSPAENQVVRGPLLVDGTFSGRSRQYVVTLDGRTISNQVPYSLDSAQLSDGVHVLALEIKWTDGATTKAASTTFRVDNQPPSVLIHRPANGNVVAGLLDVVYEIRGARTDTEADLQIDGIPREPFRTLDTSALSDGPHTLSVAAEDEVGNIERASVEFIVDNTPPEITSVGLEDDCPLRGEVSVTPDIVEANIDQLEWRLDGVKVSDSRVLLLDTRLFEDGRHSLELAVWDSSGHAAAVDCVLLTDNTPPALAWGLPDARTTTVYKEQRLPLGIQTERGVNLSVFRNGDPVDGRFLDFRNNSVGDRVEVRVIATDAAGNPSELRTHFVVAQNPQSRLNSLQIIGRGVISRVLEPLKALLLLAEVGRPAVSLEYCPPQFAPYLVGARVELNLPSVELFCQVAPVPGMGFTIPLFASRSINEEIRVPMQPKIGFGVMSIQLWKTQPDESVEGPEDAEGNAGGYLYYVSNVFTELLFSWDLTPVMERDYTELTLGLRLGLTHIVVQDDSGDNANNYIPAAGIVLRVKGFFW